MDGDQDPFEQEQPERRAGQAPYTKKHPIPTVQKYYKEQEQRRQLEHDYEGSDSEGAIDKVKRKLHIGSPPSNDRQPYEGVNRNAEAPKLPQGEAKKDTNQWRDQQDSSEQGGQQQEDNPQDSSNDPKDTTEADTDAAGGDAKQKRKAMKKRQPKGTREVTDPVTHLPVAIHDFTNKELNSTEENFKPPGVDPWSDTSVRKSDEQIEKEKHEIAEGDKGTQRVFPPPSFNTVRNDLVKITQRALMFCIAGVVAVFAVTIPLVYSVSNWLARDHAWYLASIPGLLLGVIALGAIAVYSIFLKTWLEKHVDASWDTEVWKAARQEEIEQVESPVPESTQWLNRLLASIWPLVNPDLFTSIADMIEDVMQASLPRFIRMVAVDDFGQGSESVRILGIRWLPTGAAAKSVDVDGNIQSQNEEGTNDRKVDGEGQVEQGSNDRQAGNTEDGNGNDDGQGQTQNQDEENIAEGLEKEEGEFVNMEVAFAYRATSTDKRLSQKAKNAHLLIKFYLPGSIPIPIWVTLRGLVGIMRMRLQLTPDPPFVALATITLIGQPKADLQAIPLTKRFLNVMDLPFISGFVQSSIDAALAEYVAPRSLTLNLKEMLMGDDFKKDTITRGIIMVRIKKAYDFKQSDPGIPGIKGGSSDPYITVGWAKFGKPVFSTRVILTTMHPVWDEFSFLLVGPEELNAGERLRIQLWDSDRFTADDDTGRIEVDLKELMHNKQSLNNFWDRKDGFIAMKGSEKMPGNLEWTVGYFPKLRLTDKQIQQQTVLPKIKDRGTLKKFVNEEANRKMREASERDMSDEIDQNKQADYVEKEVEMIASAPPAEGYPTGVLSIQLHNITGLNLQVLRKDRDDTKRDGAEVREVSDDLPSAFATVIINGQKVFKTRTKPKNSKPFFNASTERVIRDWRTTELMISVRDARVHEDDALLGFVFLKLGDVLKKRAQVNNTWPLVGGVGFGRFRISLMFRACTLQLPRELIGWEFGTLEIGKARTENLASDLDGMRIKIKGPINKGKLHGSGNMEWTGKKGGHLKLGIRNRYSSCITLEFRKTVSGPDKTAAFGIFWPKDIADNEARVIGIPIWRGGRSKEFYRARTHCIDDCGLERAGTLKLDMKLWPGLSEYHRPLARQNRNMHDVMEVFDTAYDQLEINDPDNDDPDSGSESSDANFDDDDDDHESNHDDPEAESLLDSKPPQEQDDGKLASASERKEQDDGKRGPLDQLKDFNNHKQTLHRQHRGAMQWKAPRTAKWMKHKAESVKDKIVGVVAHHDREPDVETEA